MDGKELLEAETKQGLRSLLGIGSIYGISKAIQLSAGIVVLPILTRLVSPADYGQITTALVILQVLNVAGAAGLPVAITLEYFRGKEGPRRARDLVFWTFALAFALTVVTDALGPFWTRMLSGIHYTTTLRIAVWCTVPMAVLSAVQALFQAGRKPRHYVVVTVMGTAGSQGLGLGCMYAFGARPTTYMAGTAIGLAMASLSGLAIIGLDLRPEGLELLRTGLRRGSPTVPHDLSLYIMIAGDRLVLERFAGLRVVGRYQIAYLVGNLGASFVAALNGAWLPLVFGGSDENRWEILADTTATLYRLAALVVGALALAAPVVLRLVASPSFDPARLTPITAVVAFGVLPYVTAAANVLTLLHLGKATYLTWATPLAAASNIFLNIVLVPRYGMGAAAATTVIAWVVLAVLLKARTRQLVRIPWRSGVAARTWGLAGALVVVGSLCPTTGWWLGARLAGTAAVLVGFANAITVVLRGGTSRYRPAHRGRRVLPASGRHFRARTGGRHR